MPASLSWNPVGGCPGPGTLHGGPVGLALGVTHPGLQPVIVEPKFIPLLLHLLELAPKLLDLLLGCGEEGRVSRRLRERLGPGICTVGVNEAGEARAGTQGSHCLPGSPIPRLFPRC